MDVWKQFSPFGLVWIDIRLTELFEYFFCAFGSHKLLRFSSSPSTILFWLPTAIRSIKGEWLERKSLGGAELWRILTLGVASSL